MKKIILTLVVSVLCLGLALPVSAENKIFKKAKPAERLTNFVDEDVMRPDYKLPFNKAWKSINFDKRNFNEVYIAPVNTEYLRQNSMWSEMNIKDVEDDIDLIAAETRSKIRRAFWEDPNRRFKVVNRPGARTLILEVAITELIPNKAGFEILATAAGPAAGMAASAGGAVAKTVGSKSTIAIEARVRDGGDGGVVAMFADRESEKGTIINVKNFTWYGQVGVIIDEWAEQLVKIANKSPRDIVADTPTFSFKPW